MKPVKDSRILRAAKRRIERGQNMHLCFAIEDVTVGTNAQKDSLIRWVMCMLKGYGFYEDWLRKYHPEVHAKYRWDTVWRRKARAAWLDWMIDYCVKEEANG